MQYYDIKNAKIEVFDFSSIWSRAAAQKEMLKEMRRVLLKYTSRQIITKSNSQRLHQETLSPKEDNETVINLPRSGQPTKVPPREQRQPLEITK